MEGFDGMEDRTFKRHRRRCDHFLEAEGIRVEVGFAGLREEIPRRHESQVRAMTSQRAYYRVPNGTGQEASGF